MDKEAVCLKNTHSFIPGEIVKYDYMESYGNEWIFVHNKVKDASISIESFENNFKKIN